MGNKFYSWGFNRSQKNFINSETANWKTLMGTCKMWEIWKECESRTEYIFSATLTSRKWSAKDLYWCEVLSLAESH